MMIQTTRSSGLILGLTLTIIAITVTAFASCFASAFIAPRQSQLLPTQHIITIPSPFPLMAGFGGSASSSRRKKGNKKKSNSDGSSGKLKPKKQWDRYMSQDLKSSDSVRVAVRIPSNNKWLAVGEIKSKDDAYTEAAVIRHRSLIAEHSRRMFPAEVLSIDKLDFGYATTTSTAEEEEGDGGNKKEDGDGWHLVGRVEMPTEDIDKLIGFRGFPDLTGFYSSSGKAATGDTTQDGYASMKSKGITGISRLEVHD
mmetsp:Transcript_14042/g.34017  ORF Transcript_14042/g.34017 Transcript_14042/m.34017 type:complete len:255 (+) Transcript_14042:108-872(+)